MATAPTALHRMHVTRPKSAKGRTRTTPQSFSRSDEYSYPPVASLSPRAPTARPVTSPRNLQEDASEFLHHLPARPPSSSLNRYRVLPSIGASGGGENPDEEELARRTSCMRLASGSHDRRAKTLYRAQAPPSAVSTGRSQKPHGGPEASSVHLNLQEPTGQEPKLLLAIRSHSGQRFEWCFRPSDTIQTVLSVAEMKTGISCENCTVESMEVPRRSFPDLSRTLEECAIPNKSVLCIHHTERD